MKKQSVQLVLVASLLTLLLVRPSAILAASDISDLSAGEIMRLGEQMYLKGILPSGKPMQAFVSGDIPMDGTSFTCVSCHLHSGIGSFEANIATPPTTGRILYQERKPYKEGFETVPFYHRYASYFPVRPAYTDETLATLINTGTDPTGRSVLKVMPRYDLDQREMAILIAYLKNLSEQFSPGVSEQEIKFATVIVEGVDPAAVETMLLPLEYQVSRKNSQVLTYKNSPRLARVAHTVMGPDLAAKKFSLARWVLKGAPETWRAQLDEYYRAEPVFALLGGITTGEWAPVHRFCEENRIPALFPQTDYPVLSDSDWYTLYFARGVRQEGEAAARYLHSMYDLFAGRPVVQIVRDGRVGRALGEGFREVWATTGHPAAIEIVLPEGEVLAAERLRQIAAEYKPAALLLWDDATALTALAGLPEADRPGMVIASSTQFDKDMWQIPEALRSLLYLTYPYRLPQDEVRFDPAVKGLLLGKKLFDYDQKILRRSYIIGEVLSKSLVSMRGEYYRDYLLDVIGMGADSVFPLYERLGFGPGQRYASKGCFIVQLGRGENPQLERRSEWVTQ
ncbi:MAG: amino acid ABC transporter substrate-binding protein [Desulfobulbaceae bacterium]|nr:amino acid ABC transporter substrate-binding protein [Desulfobulbaceae bacterium]